MGTRRQERGGHAPALQIAVFSPLEYKINDIRNLKISAFLVNLRNPATTLVLCTSRLLCFWSQHILKLRDCNKISSAKIQIESLFLCFQHE